MASVDAEMDVESQTSSSPGGLKRGQTFGGPSGGMTVTIQDLTYSVPSTIEKGKQAQLLKGVTAYFEPRKMSALMGPSGSGKTTLLDLLAGRKTTGTTEGTILYAGNKASRQFLRRYTGYVEQFDTLLPMLTVEEMLLYTAELKRPLSEPKASKVAAVEELLEKLALAPCRGVKIGSTLSRGISGGQSKRVNIGIALITNPRVLFLDEPTSGLDSYTSNEVMTVVKGLTRDAVTVVATIHSPTASTFALFDALLMLVRGRPVYFGELGGAMGYVRSRCPKLQTDLAIYNEAEYLVDLFTEADRQGRGAEFADAYDASPLKLENEERTAGMVSKRQEVPANVAKELAVKRETVTPWWWGILTMIKYRTAKNYCDPAFLGPRIFDKLFVGLLIMGLYFSIGDNFVADNYINMAAVLYMWVTMPAFGAAAYIPSLVLERALFVRERNDGLYRVFTYILSKLIDELIIAAAGSVVVAAIAFAGIKLQGSFLLFWLVYYAVLCVGITLAYFVAALAPSMEAANAMLPMIVIVFLFFGGFLFRFSSMSDAARNFSRITPLRYAWSAAMLNQFSEVDPPFIGGQSVLAYYSLDGLSAWNNLGYTVVFFVLFSLFTWGTMSVRRYQQR